MPAKNLHHKKVKDIVAQGVLVAVSSLLLVIAYQSVFAN